MEMAPAEHFASSAVRKRNLEREFVRADELRADVSRIPRELLAKTLTR